MNPVVDDAGAADEIGSGGTAVTRDLRDKMAAQDRVAARRKSK
jgi:hypothetical protein